MATENTGKSTDTTEGAASDDQQQQSSDTTETTETTAANDATDKAGDSTDSTDTTGEDTDFSGNSTQQPEMVSVELLKTVVDILKPEQSTADSTETTEQPAADSTDSKEGDKADSEDDKVDPQVSQLTQQNAALQKVVRDQLLANVPDALKPLIPEDLSKATEYIQSEAFKTAAMALTPDPATGKKGETTSNNGTESKSAPKTFATLTSTDLDTAFASVIV